MTDVNNARKNYIRNTSAASFLDGLSKFQEESGEGEGPDGLQRAWERAVTGTDDSSYTSGIEKFINSEGGIEGAKVTQDYNWKNATLEKGSQWSNNTIKSAGKYQDSTNDASSAKWFREYLAAFTEE